MYGLDMLEEAVEDWILNGESLLHHTVRELVESPRPTRITQVQLLLQKGVNVDPRNQHDATPLHVAAKYDNLSVVKLLVTHRADLEAMNMHGATPLHNACREGSPAIVSHLIRSNSNIDATTPIERDTPLHQAVRKNKIHNMVTLILAGANTDIKNCRKEKARRIQCLPATKQAYDNALREKIAWNLHRMQIESPCDRPRQF